MMVQAAALSLMPMHLMLDGRGRIVSAGATLRRLIGQAEEFDSAFRVIGAHADVPTLAGADRVFLETVEPPIQTLRGRSVALPQGGALMNLGFGIGLIDAIKQYGLTDRDFAPSDLAMELLFLHEANSAMTDELSRANLRLEEARSRAEAQAFTDPLTGLFNRRGLDIAFQTVRSGAGPFAVAVLDLDHFKVLNDSHGHAAGDEMLRQVARRLEAVTRSVDVIARSGGDEFILLLPGLTEDDRLLRLGARIVDSIEQPVVIKGAACRVSSSIGFAVSSHDDTGSLSDKIAQADAALYAAKRGGRGQARIAAAA